MPSRKRVARSGSDGRTIRMSTTAARSDGLEAGQVEVDGRRPLRARPCCGPARSGGRRPTCESARFEGLAEGPLDLRGLLPGDRLVVRAAGVGPGGPPVARVVGLAVIEPAERLEGEPADGGIAGSSSLAIRPSTAFGLYIAWRARAAPGASFGVAGSSAARQASTAFSATSALTATWATSGSSSAVRATIAGAASTLPSRPRPTTAWSRTRGFGVGQAVDERPGRNAAPRLPCGRPGRAGRIRGASGRRRASPGLRSTRGRAAARA